ncbi:uncharacterized protein LOC115890279 [Sitophilus oryzae]|uniref:Uncharacterized protein LOC115890279 n=1 Tax=Sitophilus oryzae TaxID=7048 RepID=A0A6J2YQJ7_SITOR|nr:uncharacterized protein LOC115890279 [Sitophilus oryzae]
MHVIPVERSLRAVGKKFDSLGHLKKISSPVHVRFKASSDGKALEVTSVQMKHNHVTSKVLHAHNPSQRKLSSNMKESVKDYLNMKANRKMIQQKVQESTGANVAVLRDEDNNFRGLFIQSPTMKSTMKAFPEFLAVDATYNL